MNRLAFKNFFTGQCNFSFLPPKFLPLMYNMTSQFPRQNSRFEDVSKFDEK